MASQDRAIGGLPLSPRGPCRYKGGPGDTSPIWMVPIAPRGIALLVAQGVLSGRGRAGGCQGRRPRVFPPKPAPVCPWRENNHKGFPAKEVLQTTKSCNRGYKWCDAVASMRAGERVGLVLSLAWKEEEDAGQGALPVLPPSQRATLTFVWLPVPITASVFTHVARQGGSAEQVRFSGWPFAQWRALGTLPPLAASPLTPRLSPCSHSQADAAFCPRLESKGHPSERSRYPVNH